MIRFGVFLSLLVACVTPIDLTSDPHVWVEAQPVSTIVPTLNHSRRSKPNGEDRNYWIDMARSKLLKRINRKQNLNKAKNIIFFLGDGMSLNTITAARILKGQRQNCTGEQEVLFFETFLVFASYIKRQIGVHGGDDVGIYASEPYSHLFSGTLEQHTIPHIMAYAAYISDGPTMCNQNLSTLIP